MLGPTICCKKIVSIPLSISWPYNLHFSLGLGKILNKTICSSIFMPKCPDYSMLSIMSFTDLNCASFEALNKGQILYNFAL